MKSQIQTVVLENPYLVGGHPALDLLNTVPRIDGELVDTLQSDQDVVQWLAAVGWPLEHEARSSKTLSLLSTARALRDTIRTLVERLKAGKRADVEPLNIFLDEARSSLKLVSSGREGISLERQWMRSTPQQVLAPIAESSAELIAFGDLERVRQCEDEACVLWFYDRTKSHHRRWCSVSTCGNRNKVKAFRERKGQASQQR